MSQPSSLQIDLKTRTVVLRAAVLARGNAWEGASELMGRLLSAPCVQSVAIDRARGTATMRLVPVTELRATGLGVFAPCGKQNRLLGMHFFEPPLNVGIKSRMSFFAGAFRVAVFIDLVVVRNQMHLNKLVAR